MLMMGGKEYTSMELDVDGIGTPFNGNFTYTRIKNKRCQDSHGKEKEGWKKWNLLQPRMPGG